MLLLAWAVGCHEKETEGSSGESLNRASEQLLNNRGDSHMKVADTADQINPIKTGQALPPLTLNTPESKYFDLNKEVSKKPAIIIFYRGGWCPYCNRHFGELKSIEPELLKLGYQIIAVSPDRPELLKEFAEKKGIEYRLLSDSEMKAATSLGIAFRVDEDLVKKYKTKHSIDLEGDSGQTHHLLPVPSVFIVTTDNVIRYSYINPNYKVRITPDDLLQAAKNAVK